MAVADGLHDVEVPAWGDLQLDPTITLLNVAIDLIEQSTEVALDPQADARLDPIPGPAEPG